MTLLLTTHDIARLVATIGLPKVLERMVDCLEADFRRWPEFEKSPRHAVHSDVGVIELMPIADARDYSYKYVNGHPKNTKEGLPTVMAFGVLADVATHMACVVIGKIHPNKFCLVIDMHQRTSGQ